MSPANQVQWFIIVQTAYMFVCVCVCTPCEAGLAFRDQRPEGGVACLSVTSACFSKPAAFVDPFMPSFMDCFVLFHSLCTPFCSPIKFCISFEFLWCLFLGSSFSDLTSVLSLLSPSSCNTRQLVFSVSSVGEICCAERPVFIANPAVDSSGRCVGGLGTEERVTGSKR